MPVMTKFLVLLCIIAVAVALGPGPMMQPKGAPAFAPSPMMQPKGPPAMPEDLEDFSEDDLYKCWFYINCLQFGKEEHGRIEACFDRLDKKDTKLIFSWYKGARQDYPTLYDGLWDLVCKSAKNKREENFKTVALGSFEVPSVGCDQRYDADTCEHFQTMMECTTDLFATLKKEGKCDKGEFEDGS